METTAISPAAKNRTFWKDHSEQQKVSGLTRADYCRQNNLNYHRLGYWLKKKSHRKSQESSLIAIKLKPNYELQAQITLCTLNLTSGCCLKIHDLQSLAIVLEKLR